MTVNVTLISIRVQHLLGPGPGTELILSPLFQLPVLYQMGEDQARSWITGE